MLSWRGARAAGARRRACPPVPGGVAPRRVLLRLFGGYPVQVQRGSGIEAGTAQPCHAAAKFDVRNHGSGDFCRWQCKQTSDLLLEGDARFSIHLGLL